MKITITPPFIKMDALLKFAGVAQTGGQAKEMIATGVVFYNGEKCTMRGKKVYPGDLVRVAEEEIEVG